MTIMVMDSGILLKIPYSLKNMNFTKLLHIVFISFIVTFTILSCASTQVNQPSQGPFYRANLITNNLIEEFIEDSARVRVVYPYIAKNESYRSLIDTFLIQNVVEYRTFKEMMQDSMFLQVIAPQSQDVFYLAIYSYTVLDQLDTVSIAFQVQYRTEKTPTVNTWYTMNIDKATPRIIEDENLFANPLKANGDVLNYVFNDIVRQRDEKELPELDIDFDAFSDSNILPIALSYALLPSIKKANLFSGIRIYISQFRVPETNNTQSYAVNIPYKIIRPLVKRSIATKFVVESIPFITRELDGVKKFVYPDLPDLF